jgi:cytosine/adenosine deaminase-related metal-dependent hydrolase
VTEIRSCTTLITLRARHVLPIAADPIENGWVRIERGRISGVGRGQPSGPVHDLGDAIILPGLVNAHTHLEFSDLDRPLPAGGGLPAWIERVVVMRRSRATAHTDEAARLRAAVVIGLEQSAAGGVTAIGEIATAAHPVAGHAGPLVRVFRETLGLSSVAMHAARSSLRRDLDRMSAEGTCIGISPHAPYSVAEPLGREVVGEAVQRRLPVMMHLAESRDEAELLATGGGAFRTLLEQLGAWQPDSPPRLLPVADWITLLAKAPRGVVVHGTFLAEDQTALSRLARHRDRLCVVVCPRTTLALSGRLPPVEAFRAAGIRVAIGTDSRASNPDLSVLAECRALVEGGGVSPREALTMATQHGAWALAFERRCGILAPGRLADLAILRPSLRHADPSEAVLDPATEIAATFRRGRVIAGNIFNHSEFERQRSPPRHSR